MSKDEENPQANEVTPQPQVFCDEDEAPAPGTPLDWLLECAGLLLHYTQRTLDWWLTRLRSIIFNIKGPLDKAEFVENEAPIAGLPDLREYGLPNTEEYFSP